MTTPEMTEADNQTINPGWDHFQHRTFSPAVQRGDLLFISGITATDEEGNIVAKGDIVAQTRHIFEKLRHVLMAAGAEPCDVVKTTDYIVDTENYRKTAQVRREFFGDRFPAATGVVVKSLLRADALIEIEAIAVVPRIKEDSDGSGGVHKDANA